jgi:hypothetical protein
LLSESPYSLAIKSFAIRNPPFSIKSLKNNHVHR